MCKYQVSGGGSKCIFYAVKFEDDFLLLTFYQQELKLLANVKSFYRNYLDYFRLSDNNLRPSVNNKNRNNSGFFFCVQLLRKLLENEYFQSVGFC